MADETGEHTIFSAEHEKVIGAVRRLFQCYQREQRAVTRQKMVEHYCAAMGESIKPRHVARLTALRIAAEHAKFMLDGAILEAWGLLNPRDPAADRKDAIKETDHAVR